MNFFTWRDTWFTELASYRQVLDTCTEEDFVDLMNALRIFTSLADDAMIALLAGHDGEVEILGWNVLKPTDGFTIAADDLHAVLVDTISGTYPHEVDRILSGIAARDKQDTFAAEVYLTKSECWSQKWNGEWYSYESRQTMPLADAVRLQNSADANKIRAYELMLQHRQIVADQRHAFHQNRDYDELNQLLVERTGKTTEVTLVIGGSGMTTFPAIPTQAAEEGGV